MERCAKCHTVIISEYMQKVFSKKFGTKEKPQYYHLCRMCGKYYGIHIGTKCPKE